jgi:hypothetical protein
MKKALQVGLIVIIVVGVTIGISIGFIFFSLSSEIKFTKLLLSNDFQEAGRIFGTDVDGDGDIDVICASAGRNEIAWWENNELTFTKHIITDNFNGVFFINVGDIDQDGDPDVLGPAYDGDEVAWWENNDTIFIKHSLKTNYESAYSINSYDVDLDGDIDILSTGTQDVTYWENDGNQSFTEHTISAGYPEISNQGHASIFASDLDNDGDVDIITGSTANPPNVGEICCWENDGTENFTKVTLTSDYGRVHDLDPIDMDNDGDIDICTNSAVDNTIDWFENTGNLIFVRHTIGSINGPDTIFPVDLDKDGDFDVIADSYFDDKISWFENSANQGFTEHIITSNFDGAATCSAIDIDDDGDIDVLGAAYDANEVAIWLQS